MTLRSKPQRGIYLGQLLFVESGLASGAPRSLEFLDAPFQETREPSAHALTADAKRPRNLGLFLAGSEQPAGSGAPPFHTFEVPPWPEHSIVSLCRPHAMG